jgi:F0F1-type ATP synthase membrane subunit b/b'
VAITKQEVLEALREAVSPKALELLSKILDAKPGEVRGLIDRLAAEVEAQ